MLDLLIAHDLIDRRLGERFEIGKRAGAGQEQRPGRHMASAPGADSVRRLPFGGSLASMRRLIARLRPARRTAAECQLESPIDSPRWESGCL